MGGEARRLWQRRQVAEAPFGFAGQALASLSDECYWDDKTLGQRLVGL
jgi:hypothetical protein